MSAAIASDKNTGYAGNIVNLSIPFSRSLPNYTVRLIYLRQLNLREYFLARMHARSSLFLLLLRKLRLT